MHRVDMSGVTDACQHGAGVCEKLMSTLSQQNPNTPADLEPGSEPDPERGVQQPTDESRQDRGGALCPYCGCVSSDMTQCAHCKGKFEPLSRQATQNAMGPWQIKDPKNPFLPGCSYERLRRAVEQGRVTRSTVVRGPTTRQFWSFACNAPGVAVLVGECHACHSGVRPDEYMCGKCGVLLSPATDRQSLGLSSVTLLPGEAPAEVVASTSIGSIVRPESPTPLRAGTLNPDSARGATPSAASGGAEEPIAPGGSGDLVGAQRRSNAESARLRGKVTTARVIAAAFGVSTLALAATLVVFVLGPERGAGVYSPEASGSGAAAVEPGPQEQPLSGAETGAEPSDEAVELDTMMDARLQVWRVRIREATLMAESGELQSLEEAATMLRLVIDDAVRVHPGATFPVLEERLRGFQAEIDNLRLREML